MEKNHLAYVVRNTTLALWVLQDFNNFCQKALDPFRSFLSRMLLSQNRQHCLITVVKKKIIILITVEVLFRKKNLRNNVHVQCKIETGKLSNHLSKEKDNDFVSVS